MRFDMNNIHTIFESAKLKNCVPSEHADKSGSKIDATLGDSDLIGLFDNICPISGDVFASMKDAAADPKNLKLTMVKTEDLGEATKIYIEAVELATFCEAADLNIGEAAEEILDTCKGMVPGSNDSELHVVFPSEALNKGELGSTRFGCDVRNDWAMQLLTGCRRYGIHVNSGVEDGEPVTESVYKKAKSEYINEGVVKKLIDKISKKHSNSKEVAFTSEQYSAYSKIIWEVAKKYDHVGKYLSVLNYNYICNIGCYPRDGEYLVAVFDTDDRRNDKEIRSYEKGDGNHDFVEKLESEIKSFVEELNSSVGENVKFDHDFDGHRFDLYMSVNKSASVKESAEAIDEAAIESKTFKGVKIYIADGPSEKIDLAIKLCNKNWNRIVNEAANRMFKKALSRLISVNEKFKDVDSVRKNLKLEGVMYDNEGNKYNPICGTMNLSFDTVPSLDPHHLFTLYVDFDKDQNIKFDSIYDG